VILLYLIAFIGGAASGYVAFKPRRRYFISYVTREMLFNSFVATYEGRITKADLDDLAKKLGDATLVCITEIK